MRHEETTLPSGLRGEIRAPTADEVLKYAISTRRNTTDAVRAILKNCWLRTIDPGPYKPAPGDEGWDVDQLLSVDGAVLWVRVRVLGFGALQPYKHQCPNTGCELSSQLVPAPPADLSKIPITVMPDWARKRFVEGQFFETTIEERKVLFRLSTRKLEREAEQRLGEIPQGGDSAVREAAVAIWTRNFAAELLVEVEGVSKGEFQAWVGNLAGGDWDDLQYAIEQASGKIDRSVDTQCLKCGMVVRRDPPFDDGWFKKYRPTLPETPAGTPSASAASQTG